MILRNTSHEASLTFTGTAAELYFQENTRLTLLTQVALGMCILI